MSFQGREMVEGLRIQAVVILPLRPSLETTPDPALLFMLVIRKGIP